MTGLTMTADEAAEKLGVQPAWLVKMARRGVVPSRKVGQSRRFTDQDLLDYLESVREGVDPMARSTQSQAALRRRKTA